MAFVPGVRRRATFLVIFSLSLSLCFIFSFFFSVSQCFFGEGALKKVLGCFCKHIVGLIIKWIARGSVAAAE